MRPVASIGTAGIGGAGRFDIIAGAAGETLEMGGEGGTFFRKRGGEGGTLGRRRGIGNNDGCA
ncbi:Uncharacterised protein [Starkeya nomas]|uniref:Uncharacterized protein n=1 Tax=Starkeya nomas TaxID=2666134 RepID=A0A5S9NIC4_9HYPH|nr:Uncharacterised protein [Starkeya nomas]